MISGVRPLVLISTRPSRHTISEQYTFLADDTLGLPFNTA
jgi:hypothetical protein